MLTMNTVPWDHLRPLSAFDEHERVVHFQDPTVKLEGWVVIHRTCWNQILQQRVALGGTRMQPGAGVAEGLRLSREMTFKAVFARVPFGGGKAVINADPHENAQAKRDRLAAYADVLNELEGLFITGEDMGIDEEDTTFLFERTPWVSGYNGPGGSDNPARFTGDGVVLALEECVRHVDPQASLGDLSFAVIGAGSVGSRVVLSLLGSGACVIVTDTKPEQISAIRQRAQNIDCGTLCVEPDPERIIGASVDVAVPCAREPVFTKETIPRLHCRIGVGAANMQMGAPEDADELHRRNILHLPAWISNAGGLMNVAAEWAPGGYDKTAVLRQLQQIPRSARIVLTESRTHDQSPTRIAEHVAETLLCGHPHLI